MSPDQTARRLADIAEEIEGAIRLIEVANMATEDLPKVKADPLSELLREIATRLQTVSESLMEHRKAA